MSRFRIAAVAVLFCASCSEEFSPVAEGPRPFLVFALLQTGLDSQVVRVYESSAPTTAHPANTVPTSVAITVSGPGAGAPFVPVLLPPSPTSGDTNAVAAFQAGPFQLQRGAVYGLEVLAEGRRATATLQVPSQSYISTLDGFVIQHPWEALPDRTMSFSILLGPEAMGYALRFFVEYEVLRNGNWVPERLEVPSSFRDPTAPDSTNGVFAPLVRRQHVPINNERGVQGLEYQVFSNRAYRSALLLLYTRYGPSELRMKRAAFVLFQADRNFFTYYSLANFFQDRYTIRVDRPDYSNMNGALGFFGALTADTSYVTLPLNLAPQ